MNHARSLLFCGLILLVAAACGTSGGPEAAVLASPTESSPPPPGTPHGTASRHVLVRPVTPALLTQVLADSGASSLGQVDGTSFYKVSVPTGQTPAGFVSQLEQDVRVAGAELDLGLSAPEGGGLTIPAGGILLSADLNTQPELVRIGIEAAQGRASGSGMRVAVLDSGVVFDHAALTGRVESSGYDFFSDDADPSEEQNGVDDDDDGFVDEGWGHGTFAASLVLAVAPDATILPMRVLGTDLFGSSSGVAAAITFAANAGVDVINLSVTLPPEVEVVREAIQNARALGAVVIGCAGNTGAEDVNHPQGADAAFLVTAVDADDVRADFASHGSGVNISAPGVDIHGAYPTADPDTAIWSGTSFSTPIVSGAFALVREAFPLLTPEQVLQRLQSTSVDVGSLNPGYVGKLGMGRLDLDAATQP